MNISKHAHKYCVACESGGAWGSAFMISIISISYLNGPKVILWETLVCGIEVNFLCFKQTALLINLISLCSC